MNLKEIIKGLPTGATILDVGCCGFNVVRMAHEIGRNDIRHFGVDYCEPKEIPEGFTFRKADLSKEGIPFANDEFDLVIANHVIEHITIPVEFFGDCLRVCKRDGLFYLSCPSERALFLPGFMFKRDNFNSTSFFDDPTHLGRPFSPQSLWRLARYYDAVPIKTGYYVSWLFRFLWPILLPMAWILRISWLFEWVVCGCVGWASYILVRKQTAGKPNFDYFYSGARYDDWLGRTLKKWKKYLKL
jgi:SAM-dependent methyltransferase